MPGGGGGRICGTLRVYCHKAKLLELTLRGECSFTCVRTYKPIAMITEPSQFSLISRVLPSYSVAYVTVQVQNKMGKIEPGNEAKSVTYTTTATIVHC